MDEPKKPRRDKAVFDKAAALAALGQMIEAAEAHRAEGADDASKAAALEKITSLAPTVRRLGVFRVLRFTDPTIRQAVKAAMTKKAAPAAPAA